MKYDSEPFNYVPQWDLIYEHHEPHVCFHCQTNVTDAGYSRTQASIETFLLIFSCVRSAVSLFNASASVNQSRLCSDYEGMQWVTAQIHSAFTFMQMKFSFISFISCVCCFFIHVFIMCNDLRFYFADLLIDLAVSWCYLDLVDDENRVVVSF